MATGSSSVPPAIVIIDDDPDDRFLIKTRLNRAGVSNPVITFGDGAEALVYFESRGQRSNDGAVGVILCDVKMPRMRGFDVVKRLRALPGLRGVKIWMLSGSNAQIDREAAFAAGADGYLVKFPSEDDFAEVVAAARN